MFSERSFLKKSQPAMPERRMPSRAPVTPNGSEGERILSDAPSEPVQFEGYKTIYGTPIDGRTEIEQFNVARGFNPVDSSASHISVLERPEGEVVAEERDSSEATSIRQQALEMPEGLQGEELLAALETKRDTFARYFDERWKGRMFESNPEKDADLDCLTTLQGRAAAVRLRAESGEATRMRLEKITDVERDQMRADLLLAQRKLLEELERIPIAEGDTRRDITVRIHKLGNFLKPENEEELRAWWSKRAEDSPGNISGDDSGFSKV